MVPNLLFYQLLLVVLQPYPLDGELFLYPGFLLINY